MLGLFKASSAKALYFVLILFVVVGCGSAQDRAQSHYESGMKLLSQQDYTRAAIEFRNAVRLNKELVGAWRELSQIDERNQNWGALQTALRAIIEVDKKDIASRLKLGKLLLISNSLDEALRLANAATEIDSRNSEALAFKAALLLRLNDNAGSILNANLALEIDPANADAAIVLASERVSRKDFKGALLILDREPIADIRNLSIQLVKMAVFEQMGDLAQVELQLRKIVEHYPEQTIFRQQLVRLYVSQKRLEEAEKESRSIANANPADLESALNVVRLLASLKGPDAAEAELMARINAGGQTIHYQLALAEVKFVQGQFAEAVRLLEGVIAAPQSKDDALIAQLKLAEMYFSRRDFDKAQSLVTTILGKDARNTNALRLRAMLHQEAGRLDAAIIDLRQALNDQPRASGLMRLLALAYERNGAIELADRQFADAIRVSNFDAAVGFDYVSFLSRRGNITHAEDVLNEMLRRSPNNVRVLSALAEVRLQRQDWAGAEQIAEAIRRVNVDLGAISDQIRSQALSGQKRFDESVVAMQKAYGGLLPGAAQPMAALVNAFVRAKQPERALDFLQSVLKENPKNAEARALLGSLQLMQNQPEQALKSFRAAIDNQPNNVVGYRALANFYLRQNNSDEALAIIQAGLKQLPDDVSLRLALAAVLERRRDYEAAISEYEALLKLQPGSMVVLNNLASLLADYREDPESLKRALSFAATLRRSQVPQFKDTLGWVYYRQGDFKSALPLLEEAAAALPNVALVRYHLGMNYLAINQPAKAFQELKKALELAVSNDDLAKRIQDAIKKATT